MSTYLDLTNRVLRKMRETEVSSITDNAYSVLVGDFVNEARDVVQRAWSWTCLRSTLTVSATVGDYQYSLTGAGADFQIHDAINDTQNARMRQWTPVEFNSRFLLNSPASGTPTDYCYRGLDANGDMQIDVYPIPDASYTLKFDMTIREGDLVSTTDTTPLPVYPITSLAYALAARERGETGGTAAQELFQFASISLGDAIALDAQHYPQDLTWREV